MFFSTDHCVARSLQAFSDTSAPNDSETFDTSEDSETFHACGQPCEDPTPICQETGKQCVACLIDSDCAPAPGTNFQSFCNADNTCGFIANQCAENFVDLDQDLENGCECEITDLDDLPDTLGLDTNCDGTDGIWEDENANVIFVSVDGDDQENSGLQPDQPVATIAHAFQLAAEHDRAYVLVTGGDFPERLTLQNGIHLFGGYAPEHRWTRDLDAHETRILGPSAEQTRDDSDSKTVLAQDLPDPTILDGLTIVAQNRGSNGVSTYALWAHNAEHLLVQNTHIQAAQAGNGANGLIAAFSKCLMAPAGGAGAQSDSSIRACPFDSGRLNNSGSPGVGSTGDVGRGGRGGFGTCATMAGSDTQAMDGEPGQNGAPGTPGEHGKPASISGFFDDEGEWIAPKGSEPTRGGNGGGGGGGGAGGNIERPLAGFPMGITARGGNGTSGSRGGCGQAGGTNGSPGGSSFGIAVIGGQVTVRNSVIEQASGGVGGNGGRGAAGEQAVFPMLENAGFCSNGFCGGAGGLGGLGGAGGNGGHGAGGLGGHSFGIALAQGGRATMEGNVTFLHEEITPAQGGSSIIVDLIGPDGLIQNIYEITVP